MPRGQTSDDGVKCIGAICNKETEIQSKDTLRCLPKCKDNEERLENESCKQCEKGYSTKDEKPC